MARLGTIDLCEGDGTTSGVGLLLVRTPRQTHAFVHRGTRLEITEGAPLIVCRFHGAESHSDALREGNTLVQEALDILSMTGGRIY